MTNYKTRVKSADNEQLLKIIDHWLDLTLAEAKFPDISKYNATSFHVKVSYAQEEGRKRGIYHG